MSDRPTLVRDVLNAIHRYREMCDPPVTFHPIEEYRKPSRTPVASKRDTDCLDGLWDAVKALIESYAPAGALPDDGARLWRELVRSSVTPDRNDYYRVFENLDAFERWVIVYFQVPSTNREFARKEKAIAHLYDSQKKLKDGGPSNVFAAVTFEPRTGAKIAVKAGHKESHTRHILAHLVVAGLIERVEGGYVRRK